MNILNLREQKAEFFPLVHYGKVVNIQDPTKQGRIKVDLPEIYGTADSNSLPWIYPFGYNAGVRLFNVPDEGSEIGVVFVGDYYTGFYGIGKYPAGESKIFDLDYPNLYGFEDAQGNFVTINKKSGEMKIKHSSGTEIIIDKDGNMSLKTAGTLKSQSSKSIEIKTEADVNLVANGTVKVIASKVELGGGGSPIARIGDKVQVGDKTGSIISGGTNTSI